MPGCCTEHQNETKHQYWLLNAACPACLTHTAPHAQSRVLPSSCLPTGHASLLVILSQGLAAFSNGDTLNWFGEGDHPQHTCALWVSTSMRAMMARSERYMHCTTLGCLLAAFFTAVEIYYHFVVHLQSSPTILICILFFLKTICVLAITLVGPFVSSHYMLPTWEGV